ncbi:MAG TPA: hypothetical protein VLQ80_28975, partial [Candidatus Saccharimonadia bacterium]|nr:hypothetical protein [Candidatus Saccharimonadia bacterium]
MKSAIYVNPTQAPPSPYRRSFLRLALGLLVFGGAVLAVILWLLKASPAKGNPVRAEHASSATWKAGQMYEPLKQQAAVVSTAKADTGEDAKWKAQEAHNKMVLDLLKQRQTREASAATVKPVPTPSAAPRPVHAAPLYIDNKLEATRP